MADQKFVVSYQAGEKPGFVVVEASDVIQEGSSWKITGSKGTLWVSAQAFIYAVPEAMMEKHSKS